MSNDPFGDWTGDNPQLMAMAAHRYCLGRMTYIVGAAVEWLTAVRANLDANSRRVIVRDTCEALADDRAGMICDRRQWLELAGLLYREMSPQDQGWVRRQVERGGREWPLAGVGHGDTMSGDDEPGGAA